MKRIAIPAAVLALVGALVISVVAQDKPAENAAAPTAAVVNTDPHPYSVSHRTGLVMMVSSDFVGTTRLLNI